LLTLRARLTLGTLQSLLALRAGFTLRSLRTFGSGITLRACRPFGASRPLFALGARLALRPGGTLRAARDDCTARRGHLRDGCQVDRLTLGELEGERRQLRATAERELRGVGPVNRVVVRVSRGDQLGGRDRAAQALLRVLTVDLDLDRLRQDRHRRVSGNVEQVGGRGDEVHGSLDRPTVRVKEATDDGPIPNVAWECHQSALCLATGRPSFSTPVPRPIISKKRWRRGWLSSHWMTPVPTAQAAAVSESTMTSEKPARSTPTVRTTHASTTPTSAATNVRRIARPGWATCVGVPSLGTGWIAISLTSRMVGDVQELRGHRTRLAVLLLEETGARLLQVQHELGSLLAVVAVDDALPVRPSEGPTVGGVEGSLELLRPVVVGLSLRPPDAVLLQATELLSSLVAAHRVGGAAAVDAILGTGVVAHAVERLLDALDLGLRQAHLRGRSAARGGATAAGALRLRANLDAVLREQHLRVEVAVRVAPVAP